MLSIPPVNLHEGQHVLRGGAPAGKARVALVLIHGRGASAEDIYSLGEEAAMGAPGVALVAPQAAGNAWYPQRFLVHVGNPIHLSLMNALAAESYALLPRARKATLIPVSKHVELSYQTAGGFRHFHLT
jgi:hypothetical protein